MSKYGNGLKKMARYLFESRSKKFVRLSNDLLNSGECSIDTEMILRIGLRKMQEKDVWLQDVSHYVLVNFSQILLSPDKKLNDKERKFLHQLQLWATGKWKGGGGSGDVSIDEIKLRLEKARKAADSKKANETEKTSND